MYIDLTRQVKTLAYHRVACKVLGPKQSLFVRPSRPLGVQEREVIPLPKHAITSGRKRSTFAANPNVITAGGGARMT